LCIRRESLHACAYIFHSKSHLTPAYFGADGGGIFAYLRETLLTYKRAHTPTPTREKAAGICHGGEKMSNDFIEINLFGTGALCIRGAFCALSRPRAGQIGERVERKTPEGNRECVSVGVFLLIIYYQYHPQGK